MLIAGLDCGAGLIKFSAFDSSNGIHLNAKIPAKLLELKQPILDDLPNHNGSHFFYKTGCRDDLIEKGEFLAGGLANWQAPTTHIKLGDNPRLKAEHCLEMLLGVLGTLEFRNEWNIKLVASSHSRELFSAQIREALNGEHVIAFRGKEGWISKINIECLLIVPEGAGAYTQGCSLRLINLNEHSIAIDFGTSTIIPQVFSPGGKLLFHQPLEAGGCSDLLDMIASSSALKKLIGSGRSANLELIRQGIEAGDFSYGGIKGFEFRKEYMAALQTWLKDRLRLSYKSIEEWRDSAGSFVAWGGGSEMPAMAQFLATQGIQVIPDGGWANAVGLRSIAQSIVAKCNK